MAAKIFAPPAEVGEIPPVDFRNTEGKTIDEVLAPETEWEEKVKEWARENGQGALRGEEWSYPRGDGRARYVIYKERPLTLIHLPTGDAWDIDETVQRGLNLAFVRKSLISQKKIRELFSSKA